MDVQCDASVIFEELSITGDVEVDNNVKRSVENTYLSGSKYTIESSLTLKTISTKTDM